MFKLNKNESKYQKYEFDNPEKYVEININLPLQNPEYYNDFPNYLKTQIEKR